MDIIFATQNQHKLEEIRSVLGYKFDVIGLAELGIVEEIPEDHGTLEENASQKAWYIHNRTGKSCFADDTGLEVDALEGAPGVYSARYSRMGDLTFSELGPAEGNIKKLLLEMEGFSKRSAQFRTVIALVVNGTEYQFEGIIKGEITRKPAGVKGFGYDPVFIPEGSTETFAEMDLSRKNSMSHRAIAVQKLAEFLKRM